MTTFTTKYPNLNLMVKPEMLQVINGIPVRTPGEYIRFENGAYCTEDKKEIAYIRKHSEFKISIFEEGKAEEDPEDKNQG